MDANPSDEDTPMPPEGPVRIPLSNESFEGDNNAYLFAGEDGAALVDTGVATPDVRADLLDGLAEHGVTPADVETIVLTHWHADHAGLAGELQAETGATVRAHPADAPMIEGSDDAWAAYGDRSRERYGQWGMPEGPREALEAFLEGSDSLSGDGADVTPVEAGDRLTLGGTTVEAVHLPGHTDGLLGLVTPEGDLIAGDALLPVYTPNVGGADLRVERPLETYLETLDRLARAGYRRALPGHRHPIDDPAGRAAEIAEHHRERAGKVLETLDRLGPADAWTVSADLFGDLAGIHILHGPGEAWAHLDHLARAGFLERREGRYHLLVDPDDPDPGDLLGR